jgi:hypothetical protein
MRTLLLFPQYITCHGNQGRTRGTIRSRNGATFWRGATVLIVRKYQSNELKSLSIRNGTYRLSSLRCPWYITVVKTAQGRQSSYPPSHLPFASLSFTPPASNRQPSIHRMAYTKHESRGESVGSFPSIPRTPPRSSGFRTKWRTLSSSARGLLCFHAYKNHWSSNNKVALHKPARIKSAMSQRSSRNTTAPWNVVRGGSFQVHTEKDAKHEGREAIWEDKMMTTTTSSSSSSTKFSSPGSKPSSEAAASANAPLIDERSARRAELPSPLYDDHVVAPLDFNGTQTWEEGPEDYIATGYTVDALIDALLQIGDSEEYDSVASPGTSSSFYSEDAGSENAAIDDKSMVCGVAEEKEEAKTTNSSAGVAWEEADPNRAWEDMKRRVMHVEEFGTLPLDGAGAGDGEPASREFRARRRRSWAEKAVRGYARDEPSRRSAAKKRRRHAGCWVREDGVFMRLVRHNPFLPLLHPPYSIVFLPAFTVRTSNVRPTIKSLGP